MIYVIGDLHGGQDGSMKYLNSRKWAEQKSLTKDDVLVQLGDFGYIWYNSKHRRYKEDRYWQEWFASRNYTTLIIPGNHENWDIIESLPIEEKWNAKVRVLYTKKGPLYIAITGEIYKIDNLKILAICGAQSTDSLYRTQGESWWSQETVTNADIENTLNNLENYEYIDYIFSHTMPDSMIEQFLHMTAHNTAKFNDPCAKLLEHIWSEVDVTYGVHCGHFHTNQKSFRKTPHRNEHGRIVWTPDIDNNFVQCHYLAVPELVK